LHNLKNKIITLKTIEKEKKQKGLFYAIIEGSFASMMTSFGTGYINPYAINALKSEALINSLLTYLPQFLSSLSQLFSGWLSDKFGKRKEIVIICVFLQSVSWLVLFWATYFIHNTFLLLFIYTLGWVIGYFGNTPWTSWLGSLIPERQKGRYLGFRNRILSLAALISSIIAGLLLHKLSSMSVFFAFGVLFHLAFICRFLSYIFLKKQYEPEYQPSNKIESPVSFRAFFSNNNYLKFIIFHSFLNFFVSFSSGLFSVFAMRDLKYSYFEFMCLVVTPLFTSLIFFPFWGKLSDKYGSLYTYKLSALPLFAITAIWYLSQNFYLIIVSLLISGFAWSGIMQSAQSVFYDNVKEIDRNRVYSTGTMFTGVGMILGAILGGILADYLISISNIILISTLLRFLILPVLFTGFIKEAKPVKKSPSVLLIYSTGITGFLIDEARIAYKKVFRKKSKFSGD